jgi:hypothetical protein
MTERFLHHHKHLPFHIIGGSKHQLTFNWLHNLLENYFTEISVSYIALTVLLLKSQVNKTVLFDLSILDQFMLLPHLACFSVTVPPTIYNAFRRAYNRWYAPLRNFSLLVVQLYCPSV